MKKKFCIFSPCFYMIVSVLAGETASLLCGFASQLAYSVFSAAVPMIVYLKYGNGDNAFRVGKISYKTIITAVFLWAGGNLLNFALNSFLNEQFGITAPQQLESEYGTYQTAMNIVCACVAAPICEEIVYRGIILKSAYEYGEEQAILVSALLFALAHGSVTLFAMPFLYGTVCGIIAIKEKSVVPCIVIHCICNTLSYVFMKSEELSPSVYIAVIGAVYLIFLAMMSVKNIGRIKKAVTDFVLNADFWWIPVLIKTILSNIIYHGG